MTKFQNSSLLRFAKGLKSGIKVEASYHFKNGATLKSHTSKAKQINYLKSAESAL